ncbi:hypothetical protein C1H46_025094 [Malus baccata]|uniref:Uncharacterized protein n=1 Tax=Malus baccata TaxID=106549 RepID=A0A540LS57_MALBA|nr:hypothetical protein C1H46_025094 [Malus baccata]
MGQGGCYMASSRSCNWSRYRMNDESFIEAEREAREKDMSRFVAPIKVGGKITSGKYRGLVSVGRKPEATFESEKVPAKLLGSEIGELGDSVDRGRVERLVPLGAAEVGLEDAESVVVLLLSRVGLSEGGFEAGEMALGVEELIVVGFRNDLLDERVDVVGNCGGGECGG